MKNRDPLNSIPARLSGWRFQIHPTRKELMQENEELMRIKNRLREENAEMRNRLDAIRAVTNPGLEIHFEAKDVDPSQGRETAWQ